MVWPFPCRKMFVDMCSWLALQLSLCNLICALLGDIALFCHVGKVLHTCKYLQEYCIGLREYVYLDYLPLNRPVSFLVLELKIRTPVFKSNNSNEQSETRALGEGENSLWRICGLERGKKYSNKLGRWIIFSVMPARTKHDVSWKREAWGVGECVTSCFDTSRVWKHRQCLGSALVRLRSRDRGGMPRASPARKWLQPASPKPPRGSHVLLWGRCRWKCLNHVSWWKLLRSTTRLVVLSSWFG